jgi:ATP-binding cassette, subfamily A (ABC1), member 3
MIFDDITTERSEDPNMPNQQLDAVDEYQRKPNEEAFRQYKIGGYTYLQNIIANSILRIRTSTAGAYISMAYAPTKTSKYVDDDFMEAADSMWNFFILLIFLAPLYRFVSNSVTEKETKIREAMKIMGLTDAPYWLSWFTYYAIINTILCVTMLLIMLGIYEYSNYFLLFMYLWLYGMTMFSYGVFVSAFFSSGKTAAIVATMLFYLSSFINIVLEDPTVSETAKTICSFFPAVAVQLAGINILGFESSGIGLNWDNSNDSYKNYKFGTCLWMNVVFFVVTLSLGLYLENVLPSAVGVRRPFYYPFTKSFWFEAKAVEHEHNEEGNQHNNKVGHSSEEEENDTEKKEIDPENFEEIPEYLRRKEDQNEFIKISNLKKKFDQGFYAIDDLNAEMYEDEIFALLGHNGAGKTTTINVLCGMLAASKGKAQIYGYNIKTQMKQIRKMMGICPQHNILFPKLTCREHLSIFADFKGMDRKLKDEEINRLLKDLNLEDKQNVISSNLSGGYKRKLSLGIALVGGSKVVFLDEPSSGMDVTARREMWDMLKKYRAGRVIILTTHYMEEADNLGDRIGIMSHGQMLC